MNESKPDAAGRDPQASPAPKCDSTIASALEGVTSKKGSGGNSNSSRLAMMLVLVVAGIIVGGTIEGLIDFLPTLVLPHGGWEHVSPEMWTRLMVFMISGGAAGLVIGTLILCVRKR